MTRWSPEAEHQIATARERSRAAGRSLSKLAEAAEGLDIESLAVTVATVTAAAARYAGLVCTAASSVAAGDLPRARVLLEAVDVEREFLAAAEERTRRAAYEEGR